MVDGLHGDSECGNWVDNAIVAILFKGVDVDIGSFSKLSHVGKEIYALFVIFQLFRNNLELFSCVQTFREDHVCSCIDVGL
jgi:hypothetical protein